MTPDHPTPPLATDKQPEPELHEIVGEPVGTTEPVEPTPVGNVDPADEVPIDRTVSPPDTLTIRIPLVVVATLSIDTDQPGSVTLRPVGYDVQFDTALAGDNANDPMTLAATKQVVDKVSGVLADEVAY